jgi:hypothetical protein
VWREHLAPAILIYRSTRARGGAGMWASAHLAAGKTILDGVFFACFLVLMSFCGFLFLFFYFFILFSFLLTNMTILKF